MTPMPQQIPNAIVASGVLGAIEQVAEANKASTYNPVVFADLTPEHQRAWKATYQMMIYKFPGFQDMFNNLLNGQKLTPAYEHVPVFTRSVPWAATDGTCIMLNPDKMFPLPLFQRIFIICHEVMHNARGDVPFKHKCIESGYVPMNDGSKLPFDNATFETSADLIINAGLMDGKMGMMPLDAEGKMIGLYDINIKATEHLVDVYKKKYEEMTEGGGEPSDKPGPNRGGFDELQNPGNATGQRPAGKEQWKVAIQRAENIEKQRACGKMEGGLERLFKLLLDTEVPWVDHIETEIVRTIGDGAYDWSQPDPWLGTTDSGDYFSPRPCGTGAGWIVGGGDTSGSRNDYEIARNIAEIAPIMEAVQPERFSMCWWDAGYPVVEEITEMTDLKNLKPKGGGGTNMTGFLKWVKDQHPDVPDMMIVFTDGYFTFPKESEIPCPIIWAISTDVKVPYGKRVQVCKQKRAL